LSWPGNLGLLTRFPLLERIGMAQRPARSGPSPARPSRWKPVAAAVLVAAIAAGGGLFAHRAFVAHKLAEEQRQLAEQQRRLAEQQRQATQAALAAATEPADALTADLANLFANEIKAPAPLADGILQHARTLQEQLKSSAQDALATAIQGANGLMLELVNLFANEVPAPAPAPLVKRILARARTLQQQLTTSGPIAPELSHSEATALLATVDLFLKIKDADAALDAAERGREVIQGLVASNPANTDWQRELAASHETIGNVLVASGKAAEAPAR
jgi:hypothetical protein